MYTEVYVKIDREQDREGIVCRRQQEWKNIMFNLFVWCYFGIKQKD